jgi:hypothetical protein
LLIPSSELLSSFWISTRTFSQKAVRALRIGDAYFGLAGAAGGTHERKYV